MSRWWTELVAAVTDVVPLPLLILGLLLLAAVVGALWYFWPAGLPRRGGRVRRRRKSREIEVPADAVPAEEAEPSDAEDLLELPAAAFVSLADRLAAEGRYAEAVRERLRAIVRDLVERGVVEHRPGWTVTELATAAAAARPAVSGPLGEADQIFSAIWYGFQPAAREHDDRMRELAAGVHAALDRAPATSGGRP